MLPPDSLAVFLGGDRNEVRGNELSDRGAARGLLCVREDQQAVVMLFANQDLEIQTYHFNGEEVSGETHYGIWQARKGTVVLSPSLRSELHYRPSVPCLNIAPGPDQSCSGTLQWQVGDSVEMLQGCDLSVKELVFEE